MKHRSDSELQLIRSNIEKDSSLMVHSFIKPLFVAPFAEVIMHVIITRLFIITHIITWLFCVAET